MSDALWYFGYGSNMCRAIFVEQRGMRPLETTWGWLDGHRLCFNLPVGPGERGVANLVAEPGARTCGGTLAKGVSLAGETRHGVHQCSLRSTSLLPLTSGRLQWTAAVSDRHLP
jgi:hypothetical protein